MKGQRPMIALTACNLVLVVVALFVLINARSGDAQPDAAVVRGQAFELVDERGQVRSRLNVEQNGEVVLRLLDQQGRIRVKLGASEDGSGLLLADDETEPGVHLLAKPSGPTVTLTGKDGQQLAIRP